MNTINNLIWLDEEPTISHQTIDMHHFNFSLRGIFDKFLKEFNLKDSDIPDNFKNIFPYEKIYYKLLTGFDYRKEVLNILNEDINNKTKDINDKEEKFLAIIKQHETKKNLMINKLSKLNIELEKAKNLMDFELGCSIYSKINNYNKEIKTCDRHISYQNSYISSLTEQKDKINKRIKFVDYLSKIHLKMFENQIGNNNNNTIEKRTKI